MGIVCSNQRELISTRSNDFLLKDEKRFKVNIICISSHKSAIR